MVPLNPMGVEMKLMVL